MTQQAWYDYPINNPHSADDGVDLALPNNTPVAFAEGGQVIDASYHDYGGQVVVHLPDGEDEYWIHLNNIFVHPGESISPDEIIGTSGGGVGDLVQHGGTIQPAQAQSWYDGHSTGYHGETGLFLDSSAHGDMNQFNQGWGHKARQVDPTPLIAGLRQSAPSLFGPSSTPSSPTTQTVSDTTPSASLTDPSTWGPALADGLAHAAGFTDPGNALARLAAFAAGGVLVIGGLYLAAKPEVDGAVSVTKTAGKAAALL